MIRKEPIPIRRGKRPGSPDHVAPAVNEVAGPSSALRAGGLPLDGEVDSVLTLAEETGRPAEEGQMGSETDGAGPGNSSRVGQRDAAAPVESKQAGSEGEPSSAVGPSSSPNGGPAGSVVHSDRGARAPEPVDVPMLASPASRNRSPGRRFLYHEVLGGKYRLEKSIARGGMGWVFLATQLPLGREVAIKVVIPQPGDPAFLRRFLLEASTCAKLSHPNIVTIHDYGQTREGEVFMAMEYLHGRSLSQTLSREKRIEPERACRIILHVLRALRAAHRAGIVHRDLKPSNVMLLEDSDEGGFDFVKVVDFGLAKLFEAPEEPDALQLTRAGMLLGSPRYMAPEQIRNRDVDPRTDVYALGVIFFYMLTGRVPFDGDNPTEILTQHLRDPAPSINAVARDLDVPMDMERIVARCLEKRPEDRYQTVDALLVDLKAVYPRFAENSPVSAMLSHELSASVVRPRPASNPTRSMHPPSGPPGRMEEGVGSGPGDSEDNGVWWSLAIVLAAVVFTLGFWALILP